VPNVNNKQVAKAGQKVILMISRPNVGSTKSLRMMKISRVKNIKTQIETKWEIDI